MLRPVRPLVAALLLAIVPLGTTYAVGPSVVTPRRAIGIDGTTATHSGLNASSHTISHTITSNTDGLLVVAICYGNGHTRSISTITWNTTENLTQIGRVNNATNNKATEWWRTPAGTPPATGTHNLVITMDAAVGAVQKIGGSAVSLTGVDQTTPDDAAFDANTGNSNNPTGSIDTVTDGAYVFAAGCGTDDVSSGTSAETELWDLDAGGTNSSFFYGAYAVKATAGTQTMSETWDASFNWSFGIIAIRPAGAAASSCPVCAAVNALLRGGGFPFWKP